MPDLRDSLLIIFCWVLLTAVYAILMYFVLGIRFSDPYWCTNLTRLEFVLFWSSTVMLGVATEKALQFFSR